MSKYDEDYQVMKALYLEYFQKLEKETEELKEENYNLKKTLDEIVFKYRDCYRCGTNPKIFCKVLVYTYDRTFSYTVNYYFCSDSCKNAQLKYDKIIYEFSIVQKRFSYFSK